MDTILFFTLGASIGSFIGLTWYRFPEKSLLFPPSFCDNCQQSLEIRDLCPLVSVLINGFRCRFCHIKLSLSYFFIELFCGILLCLIYHQIFLTWADLAILYGSLLLSLFDLRDHSYPLTLWLIFTGLLIIFYPITTLFLLFLTLAFLAEWKLKAIGSGDFLFLASLSLTYSLSHLLWLIQIACLLGVSACLLFKSRKIPFIPYLSFSLLITLFFYH
ncbi:prepilin peptidase [Streptococcus iniae]|uniref:Prepilin peptidase n=1 Tax=Streptococcus iniae TaxID=1346 RepID=A0A3L8GND0_STRIN|nr:A24 family peptidase [Streptococcus iniae]RLU55362.1 prepilin peptidase [Streptococcus iniae]RLU57974.1 prepilin peptidase [Streptococcus iniae]